MIEFVQTDVKKQTLLIARVYEQNMCHQRRIDNEKNISYEETPAIVIHPCKGRKTKFGE